MNGTGEDFFAGSAFTEKQNCCTAASRFLGQINGLLHLGALSDNQTISLFELFREDFDTALKALLLQRSPRHQGEVIRLQGPGCKWNRFHLPSPTSINGAQK